MSMMVTDFLDAASRANGIGSLKGYYIQTTKGIQKISDAIVDIISQEKLHYSDECRIAILQKFNAIPHKLLDSLEQNKFENIETMVFQQSTPPFEQMSVVSVTGRLGLITEFLSNHPFGPVIILQEGTHPDLFEDLNHFPGELIYAPPYKPDAAPAP